MATKRDFITTYGLQSDKSGVGSNTLVVDSVNDRVGISASTPLAKIDSRGTILVATNSTGNNLLGFGNTTSIGPLSGAPDGSHGSSFILGNSSTGSGAPSYLSFWTTAGGVVSERARIHSTGEVTIGSTSTTGTASQPLQVTGGAYVSGNLGLGVIAPLFKADIAGDARITSTNRLRFGGTTATTNFYIQYNSTANSLDFVAG